MVRKRAFTMVEMMVVMGILILVVVLAVQSTMLATRSMGKVQSSAGAFSQARSAFEQIQEDARTSDAMIAAYPLGTPTINASDHSAVIFRRPVFNASGDAVPGEYDVIAYQFVATDGADGPFILQRSTAHIAAGTSGGDLSTPVTVARRVANPMLASIGHQAFFGDNATMAWALNGVPQGDLGDFKEQILIGGKNVLGTSNGFFNVASVQLPKPLKYGVMLDVLYRTDPTIVADGAGANLGNSLFLSMTVRPTWTDAANATKTRDIVLQSMVPLMNHP